MDETPDGIDEVPLPSLLDSQQPHDFTLSPEASGQDELMPVLPGDVLNASRDGESQPTVESPQQRESPTVSQLQVAETPQTSHQLQSRQQESESEEQEGGDSSTSSTYMQALQDEFLEDGVLQLEREIHQLERSITGSAPPTQVSSGSRESGGTVGMDPADPTTWCYCENECYNNFDTPVAMRESFRSLSQIDRLTFVRAVMFANSTCSSFDSTTRVNDLLTSPGKTPTFKLRASRAGPNSKYSTRRRFTAFALRGARVCRDFFLNVVQVSHDSLTRHGKQLSGEQYSPAVNGRAQNRAGKETKTTKFALDFLDWYMDVHASVHPGMRGRIRTNPLMLLPSSMNKTIVWRAYVQGYGEAVKENKIVPDQVKDLQFNSFVRLWNTHRQHYQFQQVGSDFCDTCTRDTNLLSKVAAVSAKARTDEDRELCKQAKAKVELRIKTHFQQYTEAKAHYKKTLAAVKQSAVAGQAEFDMFVFDFAEKILLPRLEFTPGRMYYVTGLKMDLFGVTVGHLLREKVPDKPDDLSNFRQMQYNFALQENHWPNVGKISDHVISMLFHTVACNKKAKKVVFQADNCPSQNKNQYVAGFCQLLTELDYYEEVELRFMTAGHAKCCCDSTFGNFKRLLKASVSCETPDRFRSLLAIAANSVMVNPCTDGVRWYHWRDFLASVFEQPAIPGITKAHWFKFKKGQPIQYSGEIGHEILTHDPMFIVHRDATGNVVSRNLLEELEKHRITEWPTLCELKSTHLHNRLFYLVQHMKERLSGLDALKRFFDCGNPLCSHNFSGQLDAVEAGKAIGSVRQLGLDVFLSRESTVRSALEAVDRILGPEPRLLTAESLASKRAKSTRRCGKCREVGHTRKKCPNDGSAQAAAAAAAEPSPQPDVDQTEDESAVPEEQLSADVVALLRAAIVEDSEERVEARGLVAPGLQALQSAAEFLDAPRAPAMLEFLEAHPESDAHERSLPELQQWQEDYYRMFEQAPPK